MSCLEFASLQLSASLAVCRGFPLDRKGNKGRKKGKKARFILSLCAGVLADVISKYAALIAATRGEVIFCVFIPAETTLPIQPGFLSCKPHRSISYQQKGKAVLAWLIMTTFHNICWMLCNV